MVRMRISLIIGLTILIHLCISETGILAPSVDAPIKPINGPETNSDGDIESTYVSQENVLESGQVGPANTLKEKTEAINQLPTNSEIKGVQESIGDIVAEQQNNEKPFDNALIKRSAEQDLNGLILQPQNANSEPSQLKEPSVGVQPGIHNSVPLAIPLTEEQKPIQEEVENIKDGGKQSIPPLEKDDGIAKESLSELKVDKATLDTDLPGVNLPILAGLNLEKKTDSIPIITPHALIQNDISIAEEKSDQIPVEESDNNPDERQEADDEEKDDGKSSKNHRFDPLINMISGDEEAPKKCKVEILKAFGMSQEKFFEMSQPSKADTKMYCRRNSQTCCSATHFQSLMEGFTKATTKLRKSFEPVEELFTMFRGKVYSNFIAEVSGDDNCSSYVNEAMAMIGKDPSYFFDTEHTKMRTQEIFSILVDLEFYIKRQIWFYGNLVCTICNPNENNFIEYNKSVPVIKAMMNTCSDILETYEFEIRLIKLFNFFIRPVADVVRCKSEQLTDDEYPLSSISNEELFKMENRFKSCYSNFSESNMDCVNICSKKMTVFDTRVDFLTPIKDALKIIFHKFTKQTITKYYTNIKEEEFQDAAWEPIHFFHPLMEKGSSNFKRAKWVFGSTGINIYNNHISKKFYNYQSQRKNAASF